MKKSREENLARRYCEYLGLTIKTIPIGSEYEINVCPKEYSSGGLSLIAVWLTFDSWRNLLFGRHDTIYDVRYGLCENWNFRHLYAGWNKIDDMVIQACSLEELELQLSIRGF